MYLSSSLEPTGPKSKGHYIILHHSNRRDLVKLPRSYLDLQKKVEKMYHIDPDKFYVETKELNMCAGERIRIPEEVWDDVAELLGNIYVVPDSADAPEERPESAPAPGHSQTYEGASTMINLVKDELVVFNLGVIDFNAKSTPNTELNIRILGDKKDSALTIRIFPHTGTTLLASTTNDTSIIRPLKQSFPMSTDHSIIVYKHQNHFRVLYDLQLVGAVKTSTLSPLTSVAFDLGGERSPFKGPISTNVYSGYPQFHREFRPYRSVFFQSNVPKDAIYGKILAYERGVRGILESIGREIFSFEYSSSGTKWRRHVPLLDQWVDTKWEASLYSVFVIRYNLPSDTTEQLEIVLGPRAHNALQVVLNIADIQFWENRDGGTFESYYTIKPVSSMHNVVFDFGQATVLPRTTVINRKPKDMWLVIPKGSVEVDVYEFGA